MQLFWYLFVVSASRYSFVLFFIDSPAILSIPLVCTRNSPPLFFSFNYLQFPLYTIVLTVDYDNPISLLLSFDV
ncbi:hypothetical protein CW304_14390 [Bacillus sp. UFRGS-B20]|nr:hypothetical protein CW304_14390 [Bacillus sp. UFRGS-B20]